MVWRSKTVWSYFFPILIPNQVKASFLKFLIIWLINDTGLISLDKSLVLPFQVYKMIVMGGGKTGPANSFEGEKTD